MKRQGGFTLIELVVVIVILGILAVTAAPRFLNLQDDAREATLQGLAGAIQGAAGIVYGKSAIEGTEASSSAVVTMSNQTINTAFGYPKADEDDISAIVTGLGAGEDFVFIQVVSGATPAEATFGIPEYTTSCVKYTEAANADTPAQVAVGNDGCTTP
ncbi:type II secretion system GspH family protein [Vibrio aestuarianus]|uniref:type II secretion system protein n=1 Tax=Vibrio aestuarianus TaxID=28171 RepID=UPI00237C7208|nr:type II secretion system protein [Vibrio aestuarianus]MDE1252681.1 type II secretion system GspH family protein [Vibrio aestuarianus]